MSELTSGISWLAVGAGAVASFLLGWVWYLPNVFGTKWAHGVGVQLGSAASLPVGALVSQLIGLFLLSWLVGVTAVANALSTLILATAAFTVLAYSGGMFARKSGAARAIEAGYWIASLVVMVICQAVIR